MSAPSCGCGAERSVNSSGAEANIGLAAAAASLCLGVWGSERGGKQTSTMASSQGKNELKFADWMATLPESIHSIPLTNLAIPGRYPLHLPRPASSYTQC